MSWLRSSQQSNQSPSRASQSEEPYEKIAQVGEGTYGKVYKARDSESGQLVALKRIRLENEKEGFPVTAMREIRLLQKFKHPNILHLREILSSSEGVYMVIDYMDYDLTGLLSHPGVVFESNQIKCVMQQLLCGLDYLHDLGVIHRDIKGSNVLVDVQGNVRLADFGLARVSGICGLPIIDQEDADDLAPKDRDFTNRVITLWYRPPELLLGATVYDASVDIFGVGALLLEMYAKKAVFQGVDEMSQLEAIYKICGTPTAEDWPEMITLPWYYLLSPRVTYESQLHTMYGSLTEKTMELVMTLLAYNPKKRLTAKLALDCDYFVNEYPPPCEPHQLPKPEGDWHEFESKQLRRKKQQTQVEERADDALKRKRSNK